MLSHERYDSAIALSVRSTLAALLLALTPVGLVNGAALVEVQAEPPAGFPEDGFSHSVFEQLLRQFVDADGRVDYQTWYEDRDAIANLDSYLAALAAYSPDNAPERFPSRDDALAYWLYAYNAFVIKGILQHWPLESVIDIRSPVQIAEGQGFFHRLRFTAGGKPYSLLAVEKTKIRKPFRDPRIHFVLNCGSESCPVLVPDLPTGPDLEGYLDEATTRFIADPRNVRIDHDMRVIYMSAIFKWYRKEYINELRRRGRPTDNGLKDYLRFAAPETLRTELERGADYEVAFLDYDWSINDTKQE